MLGTATPWTDALARDPRRHGPRPGRCALTRAPLPARDSPLPRFVPRRRGAFHAFAGIGIGHDVRDEIADFLNLVPSTVGDESRARGPARRTARRARRAAPPPHPALRGGRAPPSRARPQAGWPNRRCPPRRSRCAATARERCGRACAGLCRAISSSSYRSPIAVRSGSGRTAAARPTAPARGRDPSAPGPAPSPRPPPAPAARSDRSLRPCRGPQPAPSRSPATRSSSPLSTPMRL